LIIVECTHAGLTATVFATPNGFDNDAALNFSGALASSLPSLG
jgi:hypothetical protein